MKNDSSGIRASLSWAPRLTAPQTRPSYSVTKRHSTMRWRSSPKATSTVSLTVATSRRQRLPRHHRSTRRCRSHSCSARHERSQRRTLCSATGRLARRALTPTPWGTGSCTITLTAIAALVAPKRVGGFVVKVVCTGARIPPRRPLAPAPLRTGSCTITLTVGTALIAPKRIGCLVVDVVFAGAVAVRRATIFSIVDQLPKGLFGGIARTTDRKDSRGDRQAHHVRPPPPAARPPRIPTNGFFTRTVVPSYTHRFTFSLISLGSHCRQSPRSTTTHPRQPPLATSATPPTKPAKTIHISATPHQEVDTAPSHQFLFYISMKCPPDRKNIQMQSASRSAQAPRTTKHLHFTARRDSRVLAHFPTESST